jgi:hypothetical protein
MEACTLKACAHACETCTGAHALKRRMLSYARAQAAHALIRMLSCGVAVSRRRLTPTHPPTHQHPYTPASRPSRSASASKSRRTAATSASRTRSAASASASCIPPHTHHTHRRPAPSCHGLKSDRTRMKRLG